VKQREGRADGKVPPIDEVALHPDQENVPVFVKRSAHGGKSGR